MTALFAPLFAPARLREALSDRAWIRAMLETEAALAAAEADAGVIPVAPAEAIAAACRPASTSPGSREASLDAGNPAVPLVERLRAAARRRGRTHVHRGATSQDVLDTAAMLVARRALALVTEELDGVARRAAPAWRGSTPAR